MLCLCDSKIQTTGSRNVRQHDAIIGTRPGALVGNDRKGTGVEERKSISATTLH